GVGAAIAFLFGASVGSFATTAAYRMPRDISIITPRSMCESCERQIPWWANIPIFAFIGLRGRCIMCGAPIRFRHFLTEAALAVTALYLYLTFPLPDAIARFVLCASLFTVAWIDYDWRLIPNLVTFPGTLIGFAAAALVMPEVGWKSSLIGIAAGAGVLFLTGLLYQLLRGREGVGLGDVFLLGMVGGFLGWQGVLFTLFFGSLLGGVGGIAYALASSPQPAPLGDPASDPAEADVSLMQTTVPFGPFLALAAGIYALFQPQLTRWYLGG
ncbi:MAG TPA: prepilin peptidase, partial [Candidatus Binataceae bacterium]|nr:prepilin peptidase [Candidatus Binataceae bacterium]